jgi:phosphoglycolate phosphatase
MSKVNRGRELLAEIGREPDDVLLIGDTGHDYEVSRELGCDCLLISSGHQSFQRISNYNTGIVGDISKVCEYLVK